jgi:hypothetical protein
MDLGEANRGTSRLKVPYVNVFFKSIIRVCIYESDDLACRVQFLSDKPVKWIPFLPPETFPPGIVRRSSGRFFERPQVPRKSAGTADCESAPHWDAKAKVKPANADRLKRLGLDLD